MKERGIIFSPPMVQAILAGRKTQTRRLSVLQKFNGQPDRWRIEGNMFAFDDGFEYVERPKCPYGQPGDRLWVREKHWAVDTSYSPEWPFLLYDDEIQAYSDSPYQEELRCTDFDADHSAEWWESRRFPSMSKFGPKPSIHMPRWASRITLEIVNVRVERLQDISIVDALAEGITCPDCGYTFIDAGTHMDHGICVNKWLAESKVKDVGDHAAIEKFRALWNSIHGEGAWDQNPWVWVIEFDKVQP